MNHHSLPFRGERSPSAASSLVTDDITMNVLRSSILFPRGSSLFLSTKRVRFPSTSSIVRSFGTVDKPKITSVEDGGTGTSGRKDRIVATFEQWRRPLTRSLYVGGGIASAYVISRIMMKTTNWFLSIPPGNFIWYGFVSGFLSAGICGSLAYAARKAVTIRPENVYNMSKQLIDKNSDIQAKLGGLTTPGKLKAYKIDGGNISISSASYVPRYIPPRVQMLYNMFGPNGREGMVSVEAEKINGTLTMKLVVVDIGREMHLVAGLEERMKVAGQLRGFLQSERVSYMKQDIFEENDDVEPLIE